MLDADTSGIGLAVWHRVVEHQVCAAAARSVSCLHLGAANIERQRRHPFNKAGFAHGEADTDNVARVEQAVLHAAGRRDDRRHTDGRRGGVDQVSGVVGHAGETQRRIVAGNVFECCKVGAAVKAQAAVGDADAAAVGLAGQDGVVENQCLAATAGGVVGGHQGTADIEHELRRACDKNGLRHVDRDAEHVVGVQGAVLVAAGRTDGHAVDAGRSGVDADGRAGAGPASIACGVAVGADAYADVGAGRCEAGARGEGGAAGQAAAAEASQGAVA